MLYGKHFQKVASKVLGHTGIKTLENLQNEFVQEGQNALTICECYKSECWEKTYRDLVEKSSSELVIDFPDTLCWVYNNSEVCLKFLWQDSVHSRWK